MNCILVNGKKLNIKKPKKMQRENLKTLVKEHVEDTVCDLSLSELSEVPVKEIASYKRVTTLDLSSNRLVVIHDNIALLYRLVKLDLSKNKIESLPNAIGQLDQLRHLDLFDNRLEHLPITFASLRRLRYLDLKGNPLSSVWQKVVGHCITTEDCQQAAKNTVKLCAAVLEREDELIASLADSRAHSAELAEATSNKKPSKKGKGKNKKSSANVNNDLSIKEVTVGAATSQQAAANKTATNQAKRKATNGGNQKANRQTVKRTTHSPALTSILIFLLLLAINVLIIYMIMFKNPEIADKLIEYIPQQYRDWILTKTEIFRLRLSDWISEFRTPPEEH